MKSNITFFIALLLVGSLAISNSYAQVSINTDNSSPDASAMLDIKSTDKGMLVPRMTTSQRVIINAPATGLLVFDTDTGSFWFYNGTTWLDLSAKEDADADPTNEIQDLNLNLLQNILSITNHGTPTFIDLSPYLDNTNLTEAEVDAFVGNNGYITNANDADADPTNEIELPETDGTLGQFLQTNGAGTVSWATHTDNVDDADADPNNEIELPETDGTLGQFLQTNGAGAVSWATHTDNVDDADADPTNEIELPETDGALGQFLQTNGAGTVSWATHTDNVNDADADAANELITNATLNGTALEITDAGGTTSVELNSLIDEDWTYNSGTGDAGEVYHSGQVAIGTTTASVNGGLYRLYSKRQSGDGAAIMGYNGTSSGLLGVWDADFPDVDLPNVQSVGILGYCPDFANNSRAAVMGYAENTEGAAYAGLFQSLGANTQVNYGIYVNAANSTNDNFSGYFLGAKNYFEGNVGIGTTTPTTKLHVGGTILAGALDDTPNTGMLNGGEGIVMPGTTSDYTVSVQDGNGRVQHKWNATYGSNETFVVGGEDAAFIDITGNASGNNDAWIEFKHADGSSASAGDAISWNAHLMINQGGEIGINESSPDDRLHVTTGGNGTRLRAENTGTGWAGFLAKNTAREIFIGVQGNFDHTPGEFHIYDNTATARRMVIDAAGNVGFGRNNPAVKLDVNGSVNCTGGTCSSDIRWKKDIQPLENALNNILQLRGVSYDWRKEEFPDREFNNDRQIGLIAQEVEAIYPELVKTDEEGFKSMDYMSFSAVLLEAVKTLKAENDQLKQTIQKDKTTFNQQFQQQEMEIELLKTQMSEIMELLEAKK